MHPYLRNFLLIVAAALLAAALGGLFALALAAISPEFVRSFAPHDAESPRRFGVALGAVMGLFLGAGSMALVMVVAAVGNWFRPRPKDGPAA